MSFISRLLVVCVGLVAASAQAVTRAKSNCGSHVVVQGAFEMPPPTHLFAEERSVLNALLFHAGARVEWTEFLEKVVAEFLSDGRLGLALEPDDFDQLAKSLPPELIDVLRRGQKSAVTGEVIGVEKQLTYGRLVALKRHVLDALIAQSGVRMIWDVRLEQAATYVIEMGEQRKRLAGADYDYLTRCLRNGGSNPQMIDVLMRVLRGPDL